MSVFDFIVFNDEIELLELRLNILNPYVDHFVITEGAATFQGIRKKYNFSENKEKFKQFFNKIIHIKLPYYCFKSAWTNGFLARNIAPYVIKKFLKDTDIVMSSDLDEIPNPSTIQNYKDDQTYVVDQSYHYYKFNLMDKYHKKWLGTIISRAKNLFLPEVAKNTLKKTYSLNTVSFQKFRDQREVLPKIPNGGWHFSFCFSIDLIRNKIRSYEHAEDLNYPEFTNREYIRNCIKNKVALNHLGPKGDGMTLKRVDPTEEYLPKYLVDNLDKYKHLIED